MKELKKVKITIECPNGHYENRVLVMQINSGVFAWHWIPYFRRMLEFASYGKESIDALFNKKMEE